jgi:hypothetical protein
MTRAKTLPLAKLAPRREVGTAADVVADASHLISARIGGQTINSAVMRAANQKQGSSPNRRHGQPGGRR